MFVELIKVNFSLLFITGPKCVMMTVIYSEHQTLQASGPNVHKSSTRNALQIIAEWIQLISSIYHNVIVLDTAENVCTAWW